ncbi:MAG: DMT family transporter [Firmicutes bacterium]|nr:DMT family transporter [Bacillota bacterium]
MSQRAKGFAFVIISAMFFGLVPLYVKTAMAGGGNSISVAFYRFLLSLPALYIVLKIKKEPMAITMDQFKKIILITACGYGGTTVLLFSAYNFIPTGMATTLHFVYPVFTIIGCIVFFKAKINLLKIISAILCMSGIILFYNGEGGANLLGMTLAFMSGLTYTFYVIYLDKGGLGQMPAIKLIFYMNCVAAVMIFIVAMVTGEFTADLTPQAWVVLLVFASLTSLVGVFGFQIGVKYIGPESASILSTFEPITSVIIGVLVYQESFDLKTILGCVCILTSTIIVAKMEE